jgi:hypothetical protein
MVEGHSTDAEWLAKLLVYHTLRGWLGRLYVPSDSTGAQGRVEVTLSEDLGPPMTVPHLVLLGVVLRGLQNWRLSLAGTPMLVPPLQWPERGGPEVQVIYLLGGGQASAGLDLLPQELKWNWLVVLLPREREIELRGYLDLQLSVRRWQDWCILASPGIQLPEELGEQA